MRIRLVANAHARRGAVAMETARSALQGAGIEIVAGDERVDAIVVAGGDGSLVHAIPDALAAGIPIGLLPFGTFNELARTLGIPFDVAAACATIAGGVTRAIDVARVNGVYYASEASIGASSRITRLQRSSEKQRLGWIAVVASVVHGLRYVRPFNATVEHGDSSDHLRAIQITVANSNRFGGVINVRNAAIDDGALDCFAIEAGGIFPVVALFLAVLRRGADGLPGLRTYRGSAIHIRTPHPRHIVADGEPAGSTPATFEVLPRALEIFVPRG